MPGICMSSAASSVSVSSTSASSFSPSEQTMDKVEGNTIKKTKAKKNRKRGAQSRANHEARKREKRNANHQSTPFSSSTSSFEHFTSSYAVSGSQIVQDVCSIHGLADAIISADEVDGSDDSYPEKFFTKSDQFLKFNAGPSWDRAEGEYLDTVMVQTEVVNDRWALFPGEDEDLLQEKDLANNTASGEAVIEPIPKTNKLFQGDDVTQIDKEFVLEVVSEPISIFRQNETTQVDKNPDAASVGVGLTTSISGKSIKAGTEEAFKDTIMEDIITEDITMENSTAEDITIENSIAEDITMENSIAEDIAIENSIAEDTIAGDTIIEDVITKEGINILNRTAIGVPQEVIQPMASKFEPLVESVDTVAGEEFKYDLAREDREKINELVTKGIMFKHLKESNNPATKAEFEHPPTELLKETVKLTTQEVEHIVVTRSSEKEFVLKDDSLLPGFGPSYAVAGSQIIEQACSLYDSVDASPTPGHGDSHETYDNSVYNLNRFTKSFISKPHNSPSSLGELASDSLTDNVDIESYLLSKLEDSRSEVSANSETLGSVDTDEVLQQEVVEPGNFEPVILEKDIETDVNKVCRADLTEVIKPVEHKVVINEAVVEAAKKFVSETLHVSMGPTEASILEYGDIVGVHIIQEYHKKIKTLEAEVNKKNSELMEQREDLEDARGATERLANKILEMSKREKELVTEATKKQIRATKEIAKERRNTEKKIREERERAEKAIERESETARQLEVFTEAFRNMHEQHASVVMNIEAENMELRKTIDALTKRNSSLKEKADADNKLLKNSYRIVRKIKDHFKGLVLKSDVINDSTARVPSSLINVVDSNIKELKQLMQTNGNIEYEQALARNKRSDIIDAVLLKLEMVKMAQDLALWEAKCQELDAKVASSIGSRSGKSVLTTYTGVNNPSEILVTNLTKEDSNPIDQTNIGTKASVKKHGNKGRGKGRKSKAVAIVDTPILADGIPDDVSFEEGIRMLFHRKSPNFGGIKS